MKKLLLFLATFAVATSCNKDENVTPSTDDGMAQTLSVNVSTSSPESRVDITEDGDNWAVSWNATDALSGFSKTQDKTYSQKFSIVEESISENKENAEFEGNLPYNSTTMRFVYPYTSGFYINADKLLPLSLAEQTAMADLSNLSRTSYMVSNEFNIESVTDETTHAQGDITMSHIGAAVKLRIKFADALGLDESDYTISKIVVGSDEVGLTTSGELSIVDGSFTADAAGAITITTNELAAVDGVYTVGFNVFPSAAPTVALPISVTLTKGFETYTATAAITAGGDIKRATKNNFYAQLSEVTLSETSESMTTVITPEAMLDAMGAAMPALGAGIKIENAVFENFTITSDNGGADDFRVYNSVDGTLSIKPYSNQSGSNTVTFTANDGIAITDIEFGAGSISSATAGIADGKTWNGNNSAVTLTMGSTATIYEISVTYAAENDQTDIPVAHLTDLSTSHISFNGGDTDGETIEIIGQNLGYAKSITAVSDDTTNFTVSKVADDYTFTVTPTNVSDEAHSATITVTVDGISKEITVEQLAVGAKVDTYVLVEQIADITDGTYILACEKKDVMYIAKGYEPNDKKEYLLYDAEGLTYYTESTKSFNSNATVDSYAVTIKKVTTGYSVQLGNGDYVKGEDETKMKFGSEIYEWTAVVDNGVYLKIADGERAIAVNVSSTRFSTYKPSTTYIAAKLYKKTSNE